MFTHYPYDTAIIIQICFGALESDNWEMVDLGACLNGGYRVRIGTHHAT